MKSIRSHLTPRSRGSKCTYILSGYHQNLSGSDTDVSTSTENLTAEEKRVLLNGVRQEPQGEETITGEDALPSNVLLIPGKGIMELKSPFYCQSYPLESGVIEKSTIESQLDPLGKYKMLYSDDSMHHITPRNSPPIPVSPKSSRRPVFSGFQKAQMHNNWEPYSSSKYSLSGNSTPQSSYSPGSYCSDHASPSTYPQLRQDITDIPQDYLDQSEVLKYLAKELNLPEIADYTPSEYPKQKDLPEDRQTVLVNGRRRAYGMLNGRSKSADRLIVSRSHPDLSNVKHYSVDESAAKLLPVNQRHDSRSSTPYEPDISPLELIATENDELKSQLEMYRKKVMKLQKFELEIQKVHKAYEDLVLSTDKKERLEQSIRIRLEMEVRRLQEHNKELREHFESASSSVGKTLFTDISDTELRKELSKREVLISRLLTQTKELLAEKDRQEIELQAQRATLQEQRNHIDILDNALTNAQTNVLRLEEETRKKQVYVERVGQLQKALQSMTQSSEKRLLVEKKLRAQMEKEVLALKQQQQGKNPVVTSTNDLTESVESLRKVIMEYEEKIISLETEVSKWEQRYIAESTMRQIAVDAASVPKDAKIAALERTSQESEKLIAQARTEKLKHMDELYASNRKCTELESRIKDFESKLAEKDAMIKVLQQHSQDKDTVFQNCVLGRPPRHTRAASTVGLTTHTTSHTTTTTGMSSLGRVSPSPTNTLHRRTGSASGSLLSISSESSSSIALPSPSSPVTDSVTAKKSIDEQLKELDSRLSRFNHKRSSSRERKVSKSLLESMKEMICNN